MGLGWLGAPEHTRWLAWETHALLDWARAARVPSGFAWRDASGQIDTSRPVDVWLTGRMTVAFSLGTLLGIPGCRRFADHGVRSLRRACRDPQGGWFSTVAHDLDADSAAVPQPASQRKDCAHHAMVLWAAATATAANRPGAHDLLVDVSSCIERYFWDDQQGLPRESFAADFTDPEPYRGLRSTMYLTEAFLATADVTGDDLWLDRALRMLGFAVNNQARRHQWRIPQHYDASWRPLPDYHADDRGNPARPYGVIPGHAMAWCRLTLRARSALQERGRSVPEWMLEAADALFERARADAWRVDGAPGFVFTTDLQGEPVLRSRLSWTVCEGVSAAASLRRAHLDDGARDLDCEHYEHCYRSWLDYADEYLREQPGRWWQELDADNEPVTEPAAVAPGGPSDILPAVQMTLIPRLPLWPSMGEAVARGRLDHPEKPRPPREESARGKRRWGSRWE